MLRDVGRQLLNEGAVVGGLGGDGVGRREWVGVVVAVAVGAVEAPGAWHELAKALGADRRDGARVPGGLGLDLRGYQGGTDAGTDGACAHDVVEPGGRDAALAQLCGSGCCGRVGGADRGSDGDHAQSDGHGPGCDTYCSATGLAAAAHPAARLRVSQEGRRPQS
jgi:hypothetical protein